MTTDLNSIFWDHEELRPAPTVRALALSNKALLFDEQSQQIHEQNESSFTIWNYICSKGSLWEAAYALGANAVERAVALEHVRSAALDWLRLGFLRPSMLCASASHEDRLTLDWRGCCVEIRLCGVDLGKELREVFWPFISTTTPRRWLAVQDVGGLLFVSDDAGRCYAHRREECVPRIKAWFTEIILARAGTGFLLHAALLSRGGDGLLICGDPGAGKTTLSVSLMHAGFDYHSDDMVWIGEAGEFAGAPFAPAVKEGSWPLLKEMNGSSPTSGAYLRNDGQRVKYVFEQPEARDPIRLQSIILLAGRSGDDARIEPASHLEALTTILGSAYSAKGAITGSALQALVGIIEATRTARLFPSHWRANRCLIQEFVA